MAFLLKRLPETGILEKMGLNSTTNRIFTIGSSF